MFGVGGDHKFARDFDTPSNLARKAGFTDIRLSHLSDVPPEFAVDGTDDWRQIESLYANLRK